MISAMLITWLSYTFYAVAVVMVMTSVGFGLGLRLRRSSTRLRGWTSWLVSQGRCCWSSSPLPRTCPDTAGRGQCTGGASAIVVGISVLMAGLSVVHGTAETSRRRPAWWLNVVFLVLFASGVVVQMRHRRPATLQEAYR